MVLLQSLLGMITDPMGVPGGSEGIICGKVDVAIGSGVGQL